MSLTIPQAYRDISVDIANCARENNRDPGTVKLLAVSKTRSAAEITSAYQAGARHFGENYLQDALPKITALAAASPDWPNGHPDLVWHFIGALQSNKTTEVATHFSWVHTIDREKIARRLAAARPDSLPPLNVCVQVNLHNEPQKAGLSPEALPDMLALLETLPRLSPRGLMIIPATTEDPKQAFNALNALFERLSSSNPNLAAHWDTLSMGMSGDYRAAIAAGSTMVRIGTALFGRRE